MKKINRNKTKRKYMMKKYELNCKNMNKNKKYEQKQKI